VLQRNRKALLAGAVISVAGVAGARAGVLTTESFVLPYGPSNPASAPYQDMVVNTPAVPANNPPPTTWGERGAVGLQGNLSIFPSGSGYVSTPASTVQFKFNVGATVDQLNTTYGAGNWTIANPTLAMQYTYYANNSIFGGGAGTFETYWVANDSWAFGNGASAGNKYGDNKWIAGTDPAYATDGTSLLTWAGSEADLGSTTYNWLSPANNPNYTSWSTDKTGLNQGLLTDNLSVAGAFVGDITSATAAADPNVSLYLIPTSNTLGLTIFTGGGSSTPTLSFQVVSVPEPAALTLTGLFGVTALLRRRRRN
jgi:hypothetical protein